MRRVHKKEVPRNEKKVKEKLDGVDAVHHGLVWPEKWPYNSHPTTPKTFLNDWPLARNRRDIEFKPELYDRSSLFHFNYEPVTIPAIPTPEPDMISKFRHSAGYFVLLLLLFAWKTWFCCKRIRRACCSGAAPAPATPVFPRRPGAVPPIIPMPPPPYSNCSNVREPPRGGEPLPHNNGNVEIGFKNECVAMTTTANASGYVHTEFVSDNDRRVDKLTVNETAHGNQACRR